MNKYISMIAISAGLMACASCSNKEDGVIDSDTLVTKTFGISQNAETTRVSLQDGYDLTDDTETSWGLVWEQTDHVWVFAEGHSTGNDFEFDKFRNGEAHNKAQFVGKTYEADNYYVMYPVQTNAKLNGSIITLTVPDEQKAIAGGFDPNIVIQVGTATKESATIDMKNVCSFFRIKVSSGCKSIEIGTSDADWALAGSINVQPKSSGYDFKGFDSKKSTIKLTDIPANGGTFILAFVPSTHQPGLKINVDYANSSQGQEVTAAKQFLAGLVYNLGDWSEGIASDNHFHDND